jgi:hypothetical protein
MSKKKIATPRRAGRRKRTLATRGYEHIARALVSKIDLYPDYTQIADLEHWRAMEASFIDERLNAESKAEMQSYEADQASGYETIKAALPTDLQAMFSTLMNNRDTMLWIREEITYAMGIEVGRRLTGGEGRGPR